MIRYGAAIGAAFKSLFKCWALWGYIILGYLVMGAVAGVFFGGLAISGSLVGMFSYEGPDAGMLAVFLIAMLLLGLVEMSIYYAIHAGSIHLSNQAIAGEKPRLADGWRAGRSHWLALTGFELLIALVIGALYAVGGIIFVAAMGGLLGGSGSAEEMFVAVFGVLFCAYGVFLLVAFLIGAILMGFEAVGARSVVLSGRGSVEAFGDAWRTVRTRLKNVFLMGLAVFGLSWAYSMVASIVLTPIQFAFMPQMMQLDQMTAPDPVQLLGTVGGMYATISIASIILQFPMMVFLYLVWTAFYRQLVGIDQPYVPPVQQYGYAPQQGYAQAPAPPAPPATPTAPTAPTAPPAPAPPAKPAPPAPPAAPAPPAQADPPVPNGLPQPPQVQPPTADSEQTEE